MGSDELGLNQKLNFSFGKCDYNLLFTYFNGNSHKPKEKQFWFRSTDSITNYLRVKYVLILLHLQVMELKI